MDADEFLDGLALWDELKPQSGQDWVKVAERFIAAGCTTENSSPLFTAVVQAVRERDQWRRESTIEVTDEMVDRGWRASTHESTSRGEVRAILTAALTRDSQQTGETA